MDLSGCEQIIDEHRLRCSTEPSPAIVGHDQHADLVHAGPRPVRVAPVDPSDRRFFLNEGDTQVVRTGAEEPILLPAAQKLSGRLESEPLERPTEGRIIGGSFDEPEVGFGKRA